MESCPRDCDLGCAKEKVAVLPEGFRPLREVRCLAPLLVSPDPQVKVPEDQYVSWCEHVHLRQVSIKKEAGFLCLDKKMDMFGSSPPFQRIQAAVDGDMQGLCGGLKCQGTECQ